MEPFHGNGASHRQKKLPVACLHGRQSYVFQRNLSVLYLLHGAFDCDNSWSTVGRVEPSYHGQPHCETKRGKAHVDLSLCQPGTRVHSTLKTPYLYDEFERDFVNDIMPLVENATVSADRQDQAIATSPWVSPNTSTSLFHTWTSLLMLKFFSSGYRIIGNGFGGQAFVGRNKETLDNAGSKRP